MQTTSRLAKTATVVIALLALVSFAMSFVALTDLAARAGTPSPMGYGFPIVVDGTMVIAMILIVVLRGRGSRAGLAWTALLLFGAVSVVGNALHTAAAFDPGRGVSLTVAIGVGAVPPVALAILAELLVQLIAHTRTETASEVATAVAEDVATGHSVVATAGQGGPNNIHGASITAAEPGRGRVAGSLVGQVAIGQNEAATSGHAAVATMATDTVTSGHDNLATAPDTVHGQPATDGQERVYTVGHPGIFNDVEPVAMGGHARPASGHDRPSTDHQGVTTVHETVAAQVATTEADDGVAASEDAGPGPMATGGHSGMATGHELADQRLAIDDDKHSVVAMARVRVNGGEAISAVAKELGVPRSTLRRWLDAPA